MYSSMNRRPMRRDRSSYETMDRTSTSPSRFTTMDDKIPEVAVDFEDKPWSCEDEYTFPLKGSLIDPWEQCYGVVRQFDEEMITGLKDEIGSLLVVASLFLAIVTAFVIDSVKMLQPDHSEHSAKLLEQLVTLNNRTGTTENFVEPLKEFKASSGAIAINQLWFLSLTQSLAAVVLGTLCLQWLSAFTRRSQPKNHHTALPLRQMRYEGLMKWGVHRVPAILLLNVQAALVLFTIGLIWWLWTIKIKAAIPVVIVASVGTFFLVLTTVLPLLQSIVAWLFPETLRVPQCPFKSPISFILHRSVVLLSICGSYLVQRFVGKEKKKKIASWRKEEIPLLTDTVWERYDEKWWKKREELGLVTNTGKAAGLRTDAEKAAGLGTDTEKAAGPETDAEEDDQEYSRYLKRSLAFVMSTLIAKPSHIHIIQHCLQDIYQSEVQVKIFKKLFKCDVTEDEKALLATAKVGGLDLPALRKDFLSTCVLQYFADHNRRLRRTLLQHRVELYIRVNNTANTHRVEVGKTLKCPITSEHDAAMLTTGMLQRLYEMSDIQFRPPVTRRQFLKCASETHPPRPKELQRGNSLITKAIDPTTDNRRVPLERGTVLDSNQPMETANPRSSLEVSPQVKEHQPSACD